MDPLVGGPGLGQRERSLRQLLLRRASETTGSTKAISAGIASITVFPASHLDQIGGKSFAKSLAEWDLTPLHFRDLGSTKLYCNWGARYSSPARLVASPESDQRRGYADAGAQIDLRLVLFS